jgi:hypothetical protein
MHHLLFILKHNNLSDIFSDQLFYTNIIVIYVEKNITEIHSEKHRPELNSLFDINWTKHKENTNKKNNHVELYCILSASRHQT